MKKLTQDLSIFNKFKFKHQPVGVSFLVSKPKGIEPLKKSMPFCQMIREAQERGKPFYFTKENEDCFGTMVLGMMDTPPFAEAGLLGEGFEIFQDARANRRLYQDLPKLPKDTVNYVVLAPLDKLTFEPDLLIIMATPKQAEIVLRAMSYSTGESWDTRKTCVLGCSWLYVYPYLSGKVNYFPTGMSFGMIAHEVFPAGWILISIPYNWIPTIVQNLKEMKWELPSYTDGLEKFLQRKGRVMEEAVKATQKT
jgi:uncharacterized protein (DUF169 family)